MADEAFHQRVLAYMRRHPGMYPDEAARHVRESEPRPWWHDQAAAYMADHRGATYEQAGEVIINQFLASQAAAGQARAARPEAEPLRPLIEIYMRRRGVTFAEAKRLALAGLRS